MRKSGLVEKIKECGKVPIHCTYILLLYIPNAHRYVKYLYIAPIYCYFTYLFAFGTGRKAAIITATRLGHGKVITFC